MYASSAERRRPPGDDSGAAPSGSSGAVHPSDARRRPAGTRQTSGAPARSRRLRRRCDVRDRPATASPWSARYSRSLARSCSAPGIATAPMRSKAVIAEQPLRRLRQDHDTWSPCRFRRSRSTAGPALSNRCGDLRQTSTACRVAGRVDDEQADAGPRGQLVEHVAREIEVRRNVPWKAAVFAMREDSQAGPTPP